jgi:phosphomannomutase/phosphoglucomutase
VNPAIFREYDIRGEAERDFDADFAYQLGRAYAAYVEQEGSPVLRDGRRRVSVGRDCRLTSDSYADALRRGLADSGLDVTDLGVCPTPLMYFSLFHLDLDGGIQVTGSHNPASQNGFKICVGKSTVHGTQIQAIRRHIESGRFPTGRGKIRPFEVIPAYQSYLVKHFGTLQRSLRLVVDAGNATAGPVAPGIFRAMGCDVEELYCDLDGRFPNHHPDPTVEENLSDLRSRVRSSQAHVGIAFDGDADRLGVLDENGRVVWGDELLILFARDLLTASPGATIVSEVKCSQRLFDDITARGGVGIMWKAGHSLLKAKMRETHAALGGEMSGHLFFADRYFGYDDAIYAAGRLLEILARTGRSIGELLADLPPAYATPEVRIECPDEIKFAVAERAKEHFAERHEIVDVDGVRVKLPLGWGLIRASNTQPALVLRIEAATPAALIEYKEMFETLLNQLRRGLQ